MYLRRNKPPQNTVAQLAPKRYYPTWCGGCRGSPLSPAEMCEYFKKVGWPCDAEVHRDKSCYTKAEGDIDWMQFSSYNCVGCGRSAAGICQQVITDNVPFHVTHLGLCNFIEKIGKVAAESAETIIMIQGRLKSMPCQFKRVVACISGTCYNPKIFDVTLNEFDPPADQSAELLELPCDVRLAVRPCKLTPRFIVLASETSGDFVVKLLDELSEVSLYAVTYEVIEKDGSIRWSRLTALQLQGVLWQEGMTVPLFSRELTERRKRDRAARLSHLRQDDPLAAVAGAAARRGGARGRRGGRGRGRGGHRGAGRPGAAAADEVNLDGAFLAVAVVAAPIVALPAPNAGADDGIGGAAAPADELGAARLELMGDDFDVFDIERELEGVMDEDLDELAEIFDLPCAGEQEFDHPDEAVQEVVPGSVEAVLLNEVVDAAEGEAAALMFGGDDAGEPSGDGPVADDTDDGLGLIAPPSPVVPMSTRDRMGVTGPLASCYLYAGGRSVARIIRGNPRGSVSMQCYRHPACKFVITTRMDPGDEAFIDWLYEIPAPAEGATGPERKALTKLHLERAQRWRATKSGGAASSSSAAPAPEGPG